MALPTQGSYDSLYDQVLLNEGLKLGNSQLQYGTYVPAYTDTQGVFHPEQLTDGAVQNQLSEDMGFGTYASKNQYNQLATLNRNQNIDRIDNMNNGAEMGNMNSGGYTVRRDNLLWNQGASQNALSTSYIRQLAATRQQALAAQQTYDANVMSGWDSALQRKSQWDRDHPPAEPPTAGEVAAAKQAVNTFGHGSFSSKTKLTGAQVGGGFTAGGALTPKATIKLGKTQGVGTTVKKKKGKK